MWVVAGCLFEISLPLDGAGLAWRWTNVRPEVTHLADHRRQEAQHLRFRAEAAGAAAGEVELDFRTQAGPVLSIVVRIASEHPIEARPGCS